MKPIARAPAHPLSVRIAREAELRFDLLAPHPIEFRRKCPATVRARVRRLCLCGPSPSRCRAAVRSMRSLRSRISRSSKRSLCASMKSSDDCRQTISNSASSSSMPTKLRDSAHRRFEIAGHPLVAQQQHVRVVALLPPRREVMPVVAARAGLQILLRAAFDRHAAGLEEPALHEPERRHERVFRIADRQQIAGAFRNQVVRQMALEAARLRRAAALRDRGRGRARSRSTARRARCRRNPCRRACASRGIPAAATSCRICRTA